MSSPNKPKAVFIIGPFYASSYVGSDINERKKESYQVPGKTIPSGHKRQQF